MMVICGIPKVQGAGPAGLMGRHPKLSKKGITPSWNQTDRLPLLTNVSKMQYPLHHSTLHTHSLLIIYDQLHAKQGLINLITSVLEQSQKCHNMRSGHINITSCDINHNWMQAYPGLTRQLNGQSRNRNLTGGLDKAIINTN